MQHARHKKSRTTSLLAAIALAAAAVWAVNAMNSTTVEDLWGPDATASYRVDPQAPGSQLEPLIADGLAVERADGIWVDGAAVAALAEQLPVTDRSATGYSRSEFGKAWKDVDGNGCDTRNDILERDLTGIERDERCRVTSGTLDDPYTGETIRFVRGKDTSGAVQIDHVIPLAAAWTGGANEWNLEQRERFANDPLNLEAVDGPANGAKGDRLPGEWMPPNPGYHCVYVARVAWLADHYGLAVTQLDKDAIISVAATCEAP